MEIGKPKKIFIVDDDTMLTEALKDRLTRHIPHQVFTFDTGEACLKQLYLNPDIVVLDYFLNTVSKDAANGMEILMEIKKFNPGIHVILLSSQENYLIALQTIQKGAEQYVIKDEHAFEKVASMIADFG
ncbi:MAG: DNA-binding response regulator [Bacteroidetes bacterium]|nr:MAG: DNA-binding response regulator [Bacteroidota bacterium]